MKIEIIETNKLKMHENINNSRLNILLEKFKQEKVLDYPIVIDKNTYVILDGHHRYTILKNHGINKVPCIIVDYLSNDVQVSSWKEGICVDKNLVLSAIKNKFLLPEKTTKHTYNFEVPLINYPLILK